MNYLQRKKLAFMSIVNQIKGFVRTISGVPPITLSDCVDDNSIIDYKIYGESIQNGEPTPDNPIEIESVGEKTINLFDISQITDSDFYIENGSAYGKGYATNTVITPEKFLQMTGLKEGDTFTTSGSLNVLKGTPNAATGDMIFLSRDTSVAKDFRIGRLQASPYTNTIPENFNVTVYRGLYMYGAVKADENNERLVEFSDIQVVKGEYTKGTFPEYEPYGYKIPVNITRENHIEPITINVYLNEPIRRLGNYADYIDFENKKVVRNVFCRTFYGNESIGIPGTAIDGYTPFRYIETNSITYPFICNYLPFVNSNYEGVSNIECLSRYTANGRQMFFTISNDRIPLNDITAFKNWLKELNANGNPLKIYACLNASNNAEPIELPNLPTFKGTTIYAANTTIQPSNMEVTYYSTSKE